MGLINTEIWNIYKLLNIYSTGNNNNNKIIRRVGPHRVDHPKYHVRHQQLILSVCVPL
jgi:hypothetical protein